MKPRHARLIRRGIRAGRRAVHEILSGKLISTTSGYGHGTNQMPLHRRAYWETIFTAAQQSDRLQLDTDYDEIANMVAYRLTRAPRPW